MNSPAIGNIDTTNCENEPIRYSGAVQPHGALLVVNPLDGIIQAASESCETLLGLSAGSLLGQSLSLIFDPFIAASMLAEPSDNKRAASYLFLNGKRFSARTSLNNAAQLLVDIELSEQDTCVIEQLSREHRRGIEGLRRLGDVTAITRAAAELIRGLTGFDQVMIYRFDTAWNGEVIAESLTGNVEPYLGLNFPASDIPKQARELFQLCKVRLIPEVNYNPSALLAIADKHAIDLGISSLRSVSPIHIEYLKNMGAAATLVGALVVEDCLWGLVSCQQKKQCKYLSPEIRDVIGWLCGDIAALLEARLIHERRERERSLAHRRRKLVEAIRQSTFKELMHPEYNADLLGVVGADGFALKIDETIHLSGITPDIAYVRDIYRRRHQIEPASSLYATSALCRDLGLESPAGDLAGALFVTVLRKPEVTMIWFRLERRFSVRWGGDPTQPHFTEADGRISPRKSFSQFLQEVSGQSLPWTAEEIDSASELEALIEIEALRKCEAFSLTILNSMPEHISVLDALGVIVTVNHSWKRFAQANHVPELAEASPGSSYRNICVAAIGHANGDKAQAAWAGIEAVLHKQLHTFTLDYTYEATDEPRWFRMTVHPMLPPGDGVIVLQENISERKKAESQLIKENQKNQVLLRNASDGICIMNREARIDEVGDAFCKMLGYTREEMIGMHVTQWDANISAAELEELVRKVFENGTRIEFETIHRAKNGVKIPVEVSAIPLEFLGSPLLFCTTRDITERKQANAERERLLKIVEGATDYISMADMQGHLSYLNRAGTRLVGLHDDIDLSSLQIKDLHPAWAARRVLDEGIPFVLKNGSWQGETALLHRDGHEIPVLQMILVHRNEFGNPEFLSTIMRDITKRKRKEQELEQAMNLAKAANLAKSRFLANMSHEIRTPMNGILGMAQMLLEPNLSKEERYDYARIVLNSGHTLLTLLNDILDFSKVEAGKIELEAIIFDAAQVVHETELLFAQSASRKGLSITADWKGLTKQRFLGDPHRLRQMLSNLVGNAIKFTAQGHIHLEGQEIEGKDQTAWLEFSVTDTGIGIPDDKQALLFQPFSQTDGSTTRQFGGTGLGLSIVRALASLMGGEVGVQSEPGKGSRFWLRIPAKLVAADQDSRHFEAKGDQEPDSMRAAASFSGQVLVVEDDATNRKVIQALLGSLGLTVVFANDGAQAVQFITQGGEVALILMDLHMPVMDGYTATEELRRWETNHGKIRLPIIALTADAFEEEHQHCLKAGMDEVITKPIALNLLCSSLRRWLPAGTEVPDSGKALAQLNKPINLPRILELLDELEPLLAHNQFAALGRFKELQRTVSDTDAASDIAGIAWLVAGLRFDEALQALHQIAAAHGWIKE